MPAIQTPYSSLAALVVDDMPVQQSTLRGQLASIGIGRVDATGTAEDALRLVRSRPYSLILCDYNLNQRTDGQQLFEHMRETGALAPDCLFFMVTAENAYASVAAASEYRPDAYLLKPITAADISERLKMLIERRQALLGIHQKMGKRDFLGAVAACDALLAKRDRWAMQALQLKGDVLLQLGRHDDALAVFRQALAQRSELLWARVGMARAHQAAGRQEEAREIAVDIVNTPAGEKTMAAYDVLARALEAQQRPEMALDVLAAAAAQVPSAARQRLLGQAAYRQGELGMARDALRKAARATQGALNAQPQDSLTLAQTLVDLGDNTEALALLKDLSRTLITDMQVEATASAIGAQAHMHLGNAAAASAAAARAQAGLKQPRADFATVATAKSLLATGSPSDGLALLVAAVSADHENPALKALVTRTLADTGHADQAAQVIDGAAAAVKGRVDTARKLFRDNRTDEALAAIVEAAEQHPDNTGVLLQAAQIHCMALRLQRDGDAAAKALITERVTRYLARLVQLLPGSERVAQMRRYYADTLRDLNAPVTG